MIFTIRYIIANKNDLLHRMTCYYIFLPHLCSSQYSQIIPSKKIVDPQSSSHSLPKNKQTKSRLVTVVFPLPAHKSHLDSSHHLRGYYFSNALCNKPEPVRDQGPLPGRRRDQGPCLGQRRDQGPRLDDNVIKTPALDNDMIKALP